MPELFIYPFNNQVLQYVTTKEAKKTLGRMSLM